MSTEQYFQYGLALVAVIALILIAGAVLRRFVQGARYPRVSRRDRRLRIVEMLPIDSRRQLMLVRRDQTEHLILLFPDRGLLIEPAIGAAAQPPAEAVD